MLDRPHPFLSFAGSTYSGNGLFAFGSGLIEPALGGLTSQTISAAEQGWSAAPANRSKH